MNNWSTMKRMIWMRGNQAGGSPAIRRTVTGTAPIALLGAIARNIISLVQTGKVAQAATPAPTTPQDIVCNNGALRMLNLANLAQDNLDIGYYISNGGVRTAAVSNFYTRGFVGVKPSTTYTMHTSASINYFNIMEYDSGKIFSKRTLWGSSSVNPAGDTITFTTSANTYFIRWGSNMDGNAMSYSKATSITWMLAEGGAAMNYVPFGTLSVVGTLEVIQLNGFNLLDPATVPDENAYIRATGGGDTAAPTPTGGIFHHSDYIEVESNTQYFIGCTPYSASSAGIAWYDANKDFISGKNGNQMKTDQMLETSPDNAKYIRFGWRIDEDYDTDWEHSVYLCKAGALTEWQPYDPLPQTAHAENLYAVGDYADTQDIVTGAVERKVGVYIIDGTENWSQGHAIYADGSYSVFANLDIPAATGDKLLTHFPFVDISRRDEEGLTNAAMGQNLQLHIRSNEFSSVATAKAWLAAQYAAGTPVIILYPLGTPTTEQTTAQTLTATAGTNSIDVTANVSNIQLTATYMAKGE